MKKKENSRGITLIALVITIIIMIILVAVSVALAVKGDLFGNAQEGTDKTRIEAEKEQLTEYVYGQYRENKDTKKVEVNLEKVKEIVDGDKEKFKSANWTNEEHDMLEITGVSEEKYVVNKNGKIEKANPWVLWGLTANVKYDCEYYCDDTEKLNELLGIDTLTIMLKSDGSIVVKELDASKTYEELDALITEYGGIWENTVGIFVNGDVACVLQFTSDENTVTILDRDDIQLHLKSN